MSEVLKINGRYSSSKPSHKKKYAWGIFHLSLSGVQISPSLLEFELGRFMIEKLNVLFLVEKLKYKKSFVSLHPVFLCKNRLDIKNTFPEVKKKFF